MADVMTDILSAIVFMSVVVALAAGVLWAVDRRTLPKEASTEEKKAFVDQGTERWRDRYRKATAVMAAPILGNLVALITKAETGLSCVILDCYCVSVFA